MKKLFKMIAGLGILAAIAGAIYYVYKNYLQDKEFDDLDDDDFDDYDSDDYDDDDFGDDGYDDDDDGYDSDDDDGYDDDDDYGGSSNDMIDDLDDLLNMQSQRKRGQNKGDTFEVDFIDLD